ncbi:hypothetical protein CORC01_06222 [Colletotrichum orchidophilum]|uniref:GPI inositol-deacylase winged helix domain-containing protein n=1 Tax=Colletotrichum orchidophilum TaxID=1209926 RepID=A0A1G4BAJ1_9PEZI|nr:uncharacterized protein CORC01_06222 [Colletotrichum orchidophilum]OHE98431.1 hypothetical protein CORC01_06222 [Colletotrichum orchidophilum]
MVDSEAISLYDIYQLLLNRLKEQHTSRTDLAHRTLTWLSFSARPLTLSELQGALSVGQESTSPEEWVVDADRMPPPWAIQEVCMGLVIVDSDNNSVRLSHQSVAEWLVDLRQELFPSGQSYVARCCLAILMSAQSATGMAEEERAQEAQLSINSFYLYAAANWGYHFDDTMQDDLSAVVRDMLSESLRLRSIADIMHAFDGTELLSDVGSESIDSNPGPENFTPLHMAAYFNMAEMIQSILAGKLKFQNVSNVEVKDSWGRTALHVACAKNHMSSCEKLIAANANINAKDLKRRTPLYLALMYGYKTLAQFLMRRGGSLGVADSGPILDVVAERGHGEIVEMLLERKLVGDSKDAIRLAALGGHFDVVELLLAGGYRKNLDEAFIQAASQGAVEAVAWLFENGAKVDLKGHGTTALHYAARHDQVDVIHLLLHELCANPDTRDEAGKTPLFIAVERGNIKCARMLAEAGASLELVDHGGLTPLHRAAEKGYLGVLKFLLDYGVQDEIQDNKSDQQGLTPAPPSPSSIGESEKPISPRHHSKEPHQRTALSYAVEHGGIEAVELLLDYGSKPNSPDSAGRTPLMYAAVSGLVEIAELLLERGADINATDKADQTSLMLAAQKGHCDIVDLLSVTPGVDDNGVDENDSTALSLAASNRNDGTLKRLYKFPKLDLTRVDGCGKTALEYAQNLGIDVSSPAKSPIDSLYSH